MSATSDVKGGSCGFALSALVSPAVCDCNAALMAVDSTYAD